MGVGLVSVLTAGVGLVSALRAGLDAGVSAFGVLETAGLDVGLVTVVGAGLVAGAGFSDFGTAGEIGLGKDSASVEAGVAAGVSDFGLGATAGFVFSFGNMDSGAGVTTPFGLMG